MDEKVHEKLDAILKERIFDFVGMIEQRRLFEARVFITNIFYAGCAAQGEADRVAVNDVRSKWKRQGIFGSNEAADEMIAALTAAEIKEAK